MGLEAPIRPRATSPQALPRKLAGGTCTVEVRDEGAWTIEELSQLVVYGRTFGTEMGEVRWDKVAERLGCQGLHVEKLDDLEAMLAEAKRHAGPSLVCVRTDRDANRNVPIDGMLRFVEVYEGPFGRAGTER